jgi:hypothetical protein
MNGTERGGHCAKRGARSECPLLAQSGHDVLHRTCPLLTQSGHRAVSSAPSVTLG